MLPFTRAFTQATWVIQIMPLHTMPMLRISKLFCKEGQPCYQDDGSRARTRCSLANLEHFNSTPRPRCEGLIWARSPRAFTPTQGLGRSLLVLDFLEIQVCAFPPTQRTLNSIHDNVCDVCEGSAPIRKKRAHYALYFHERRPYQKQSNSKYLKIIQVVLPQPKVL